MAAQGFTKIRCSLFEENDYIKIAEEVSDWIEEYSVESEQGKYWKQSPETEHNYDYEALFTPKSLYGGSAGTAIFYIRLYQVTGNVKYLNEAKAAFEYIANTYEGPDFYDFSKNPQSNAENAWNIEGFITGLYNGPAGGGVLAEYLYDIEPDEKYRAFSEKAAADIIAGAKTTDNGIYWTDVSDLMSDGGLVLYLLFLYKRTGNRTYLEAAKSAGDFILSNAIDAEAGKCFELLKLNELGFSKGKYFPNFSHGTAGVGYLFASLYELSKESRYLEIARENAKYIESLAVGDDRGILIPYVDPPEEELFYLGVCHGPIGTSKLFKKLYQVTGEEHYREVVIRLAGGLIRAHAPQVHSKGYWNNDCFCCGSPGMLEFFVDMYEFTDDRQYLRLACESADILIGNSYEKDGRRRWYSAWSRSAPNKVESYTGLYVGSSGCAASLLRLYGCKNHVETVQYPEDLI